MLTATGNAFCPVVAFENHLIINHRDNSDPLDVDIPLFAYKESNQWKTLSKTTFIHFTTNIYSATSLEIVHGHSYCIGGTLHLLLDGVPPETVMKIGGWSSLCFLIYWRRLEQIISLSLSCSWDSQIKEIARKFGHSENVDDDIFDSV